MDPSTTFQNLDRLPQEQRTFVSQFGRGPWVQVPHSTAHQAFEHAVDDGSLDILGRADEQVQMKVSRKCAITLLTY
jgi:hypothetical protein